MFEWKDEYSVGIPSIDAQHKKLVRMLNDLFSAMREAKANKILGEIFADLGKYTVEHFAYEEKLFAKYGYPEAPAHLAAHKVLIAQVVEQQQKFASGAITISKQLANFLKTWLTEHILKEDKAYTAFLKSKGVK